MEKDVVKIDSEDVEFYYQVKKIKNIIIKIDKDNNILVSIPKRIPLKYAKEFIIKKFNWIKKNRLKQEIYNQNKESEYFYDGEILYLYGNPYKIKKVLSNKNEILIAGNTVEISIKEKYFNNHEYIKKAYEKKLKEIASKKINELVKYYYNMLKNEDIPLPIVEIRKMKARWGCCFPKQEKVKFNLSLIKTPIECVEYVVLHELSHFKYQNHSKDFYNFIEKYMFDWKERRKILNKKYSKIIK